MKDKIVLGLSGGVDSAVSACLLEQRGFEVYGLYLDIGSPDGVCEAREAADFLKIPLKIADISAELELKVCKPFCEAYLRGETPNPCIICNPTVKFRALSKYADEIGAYHIATGHYARAEGGSIYKGRPANDQSYMLCRLTRSQAERVIFPLGELEKSETRRMAEEMGLPAAKKPDSMEICFIPDKDYIRWLEKRGQTPPPGDFIFHGKAIGPHEGIHRWTVGQRIPGLYEERKLYVSKITPENNTIELALWEELFTHELRAKDMNWLIDQPSEPLRGSVKARHTKWECPECTVYPEGGGVRIVCDEPLRAPAAGQSAVIYQGERLIGGGFITQEQA